MKLQGQWLEIDKCQEACGCSSLLPGDNITYVIWGYFCTKVHYSAVTTTFCQAGHLKQVLCIIFLLLRTIMLKNVRQEVVFCYLQYVVVGGRFRDLIELVFFFFPSSFYYPESFVRSCEQVEREDVREGFINVPPPPPADLASWGKGKKRRGGREASARRAGDEKSWLSDTDARQ